MNNYKSVKDMVNSLSESAEFKELVMKEIHGKQVGKLLFFLRCKNGLSQKEMAEKLGCSQSRISKIESSPDESLSVKDLVDYGKAFKLQLEIGFHDPSVKIVDHVKFHAFEMKKHLDKLCVLAKDDPAFVEAVRRFYGEAFVNVLGLIADSIKKLPAKKEKVQETPAIQITSPMGSPSECCSK